MSDVQYPFIDVAVHDRVSEAFAAGMAVVLFSPDLRSVSWANGRGAALFGFGSIYDFLDQGLDRGELMFRQVEPVVRALKAVGDRRTFTIRIASGFLRVAVQAHCEMIRVQNKPCILLSVPIDNQHLTLAERAARLIEGFDDPETHMAVLDEQGTILAQSGQFSTLTISVQTTRMLVSMVGNDRHRLIKRPISTAGGYLPAAIGQVCEEPSLNLLFVVGAARTSAAIVAAAEIAAPAIEAPGIEAPGIGEPTAAAEEVSNEIETAETTAGQPPDYEEALSAVAAIEDNPEIEEEISLDATPDAAEVGNVEPDITAPAEDDAVALTEAASGEQMDDGSEALALASDSDQPQEIEAEAVEPEVFSEEDTRADDVPVEELIPSAEETADASEDPDTAMEELPETLIEAESFEKTDFEEMVDDDQAEIDPPAGNGDIFEAIDGQPVEETTTEQPFTETYTAENDVAEHRPAEEYPAAAVDDTPVDVPADAPADIVEPIAAIEDTDGELAPSAKVAPEPVRLLKTVRFVWKIDAGGRFSEISREFADAVGPHVADISGMAFSDLAALFNLDPDGKIAELLSKRDTWSGRTIWWPVEGTSLVVPVDLAALPTYTRAREFDGFRGFGIVRMGDAAEDPNAAGLSLGTLPQDDDEETTGFADEVMAANAAVPKEDAGDPVCGDEAEGSLAADDPAASDISEERDAATVQDALPEEQDAVSGTEANFAANDDAPDASASEDEISADVTQGDVADEEQGDDAEGGKDDLKNDDLARDGQEGERPALKLVDNPGRRQSDKVIRLEEHRSRLSPGEQANFHEIARRLDTLVKSTQQAGAEGGATEETSATAPEADQAIEQSHIIDGASADGPPESLQNVEEQAEDVASDVEEQSASPETDDTTGITADDATEELDTEAGETVEETADETDAATEESQISAAPEPADAEPEAEAESYTAMLPGRDRPGLSEEIIDQMPVALLVHAGDRLIHANGEFLKMTGYGSLEALADVGGLDALLQRQELEDKTTHAGGMVVVRADDVIVPVTARLQSIRWNDGSALMLALMPVSAPEAEQSEDAGAEVLPLRPLRTADQLAKLQVEVEELRAILETATDGVVIIGSEGDIRSMNRAASALFNFDGDEINGKPFVTLFAHESQRAIIDYLSGLAGHGVASVLNDGREVIGREASGGFLPLFMTIGKLTSSNGYCAVIRDITQWKRTEEELRTAKRAAETANAHKSEFLAHVSHEIRTPLNAIIGFADMMASERLGPVGHARYIEYSNDIGRSGRHVLDIVNDLLDISKIEAGELDLDFIAVELNETVSEAVSLVQPQANGQRVIIRTALSQTVPQVVADLRSIKQIVLNVLSNAIRFTPSGGQIVVSTAYETNGNVVLRIRDTGIGMTRPELELAMKPFRQVAGTSRKRGDGTGLGLPLTKAMVDANRANFAISSAPNEGTLVEITFPSQRVLAS